MATSLKIRTIMCCGKDLIKEILRNHEWVRKWVTSHKGLWSLVDMVAHLKCKDQLFRPGSPISWNFGVKESITVAPPRPESASLLVWVPILFIGPMYPWSDLWALVSVSSWVSYLFETSLMWLWLIKIPTDKVNRTIQGNVAMQLTQSGGQLWNLCKCRHLLTKF